MTLSVKNVLPDALLALLPITNANIDNSQRLSVLATVSPEDGIPVKGSKLLSSVKYDKLASITLSTDSHANHSRHRAISGYTAGTKSTLPELKTRTRCKACNPVGHWWTDDECPQKVKTPGDEKEPKTTVRFN